jgi:ligand-binding sensor domain-containing protein
VKGYLWSGSFEGQSRFDGYRFTNYGPFEELALLIVNAIAADRQGQPWVGTNRGGKSRLVANTLNPTIKLIGVQAERAPAAHKSWRARELL